MKRINKPDIKQSEDVQEKSLKSLTYIEADALKIISELEGHHVELERLRTDLLLAEEKARTANEKFNELYDYSPLGFFTLDQNGKIDGLNLNGAKMLVGDRSDLLQINFREFISSETLEIFNYFFIKVYEVNKPQICQVIFVNNSQNSIFVQIEGAVFKEDNKCHLTVLDITERELTGKKLLYSEIRFRRLFESAKDGILVMNARNGHIIDVNPYLVNLLGYSYSELLGKQLWELGFFKNMRDCRKSFLELRNKCYLRVDDMLINTKEGYEVNIEIICNVYLEDREKVIQCNIRDISDRKRSIERLKENETRLNHLNATKDKFFSIIAHDLKGPFTSIIGFSNLLTEQVSNKNYDGVEEYAEIIQASSWRAMELLTNLLEWSRSQTGRMELNPEQIYFRKLIMEVTDLLNASACQKSINITSEVPYDFKVFGDKAMLNTILRNLITNAIKFTNPGGNIVICATQKELVSIISVADNGVGIRKDDIERLFRIEESVSSVGTQGEEGTGLGLFLCNEFVRKHGGKIKVESELGKGSKFILTLPRQKVSESGTCEETDKINKQKLNETRIPD